LTDMKRTGLTTRYWLATLALTTFIWVAPGRAQSPSTTPENGDDLVRWQLANFDQFLDSHPEVSEQLRKSPSLVDDKQFVESHPALQQYLAQHPEIRADIEQNPRAVMHQEQGYERTEDRVTRPAVATMDQFLDSHPEVAEQLQKNPKLIDDDKWVAAHPELRQFMAEHPDMRQQFDEHPEAFMRHEDRFEHAEDRAGVATMDRFLDNHPEIAEQLKKDPKLIDDKKWVASHPPLQQFMTDHPEVRQQFDEHPYAFMRQENRYDRWEDRHDGDRHDGDMDRDRLSSFHNFLEGHGTINADISKNPTLATNDEYLQNHTELQAYLQANPEVKQQLSQNPQSFVKSAQGIGTTTPGKVTTTPKMPGAEKN
jgi:dsDNA-binding SOS-regulon protein